MAEEKFFSEHSGQSIDRAVNLALQYLPPDDLQKVSIKAFSAVLFADQWSGSAVTIPVPLVDADSHIVVSPNPAGFIAYAESVVRCTGQGNGTLTFACRQTPTVDITVNVLILKEAAT